MAARYTLCPKCSYPIPEGASHCPHCGTPVRAPEPPTNPFPPPRRLRPREPLVKRVYKAVFERYRGVVVSALLGILLLINIITLALAVPYVKEEGSGGKFVESIATLEVPGNPLEDTFNVSYEVWPGERVPSSGMTLLNITLNTSSFILPPTVRLTTVEGGVAGEARLFVERAARGILLHALFYPLPSAGYYTITVEGLGGAEVNVGEVLIEGDGITERLINDPFYPIGKGIETNLPEGFVLYLNGTPTLPSELNGLLSGDWQTLTVKQGGWEVPFLLKGFTPIRSEDLKVKGRCQVKDTFSRINYTGAFFPGQVVEVFSQIEGGMAELPSLEVSGLGEKRAGFDGEAIRLYFSLPYNRESVSLYLRYGERRDHIKDLKLNSSLAPLFIFEESPFNGSEVLKIRILRYTLFTDEAVIVDGMNYTLPSPGENKSLMSGGRRVVIERGLEGEVYVTAIGNGTLRIGFRVEYKPSITFFILFPIPPFILGLASATGHGFFLYFYFLVVVILGSAALLGYQTAREWKEGRKPPHLWKAGRVSLAFLASLFFSLSVASLMRFLQTPVTVPESFSYLPEWLLLVELASASVYEELVSRLILIGVPMFFIALVKNKRGLLKYLLGGYDEWNSSTIFFILLSSVTFGMAHSSGWGSWKVIPTFLGGLLFGYVFVKVGLHGAILMHFATDYLTAFTYLPGGDLCIIGLLMSLFIFLVIILSYLYGIHFSGEFLEEAIRRKLPGEAGSLARLLLISGIPVILLMLLLYAFSGGLGALLIFSLLTLSSLILVSISIIAHFTPFRLLKAFGVLCGAVGALLSLPLAPLSVPHLINMIKKM